MTIRFETTTVLVVFVALLAGCRGLGTQHFTALSPLHANELAGTSRVVLDVRCTNVTMRTDYNLWENLQLLAPRAKYWKIGMTLQVDRVVQGNVSKSSIDVHWLHVPTEEQCEVLGIAYRGGEAFTNGMPLHVGFDSSSDQHLQNLKVMFGYE